MRIAVFKQDNTISDDNWMANINGFLEKLTDKSPIIWTERTQIFFGGGKTRGDDQLRIFIAYQTFEEIRGPANY